MYPYVGPPELQARLCPEAEGCPLHSGDDLDRWVSGVPVRDFAEPFTFTVGLDGVLRLAPRRSEHVACAGGEPVLSAGELRFEQRCGAWAVAEVSNHSTGYCPSPDSWPAVADALSRAGVAPPDGFTHVTVFRHCPACAGLNIVREHHFVCVFCDTDLPLEDVPRDGESH